MQTPNEASCVSYTICGKRFCADIQNERHGIDITFVFLYNGITEREKTPFKNFFVKKEGLPMKAYSRKMTVKPNRNIPLLLRRNRA